VATLPIGERLARILTDHLALSSHIGPTDFVFSDTEGAPLDPNVLRKEVLYPLLDRLNIPRQPRTSGFRRFRHSAGSLVYDATGNLKTTQSLLRHAQLTTTMNVYTHAVGAADAVAVEALEAALLDELAGGEI
jgi:integrase